MAFFQSNAVRKLEQEHCKQIQISRIEEVELWPGVTADGYTIPEATCPAWRISLYDNPTLCKYFNVDEEIVRKRRQRELEAKRQVAIQKFNREYEWHKFKENLASGLATGIVEFFKWSVNMALSCSATAIAWRTTKFCIAKYMMAIRHTMYPGVFIKDPDTTVKIFLPASYISAAAVTIGILVTIRLIYGAYKRLRNYFDV